MKNCVRLILIMLAILSLVEVLFAEEMDGIKAESENVTSEPSKAGYVDVGGFNMYYEIHGEGEPLVLIPGAGDNTSQLKHTISAFSRNLRVIAVDNRGAGKSDKPDIPYTIDMMADDLAGLLGHLNIKKAHVLGISMGGMIAQQFAVKYPEKVISLVLGATNCGAVHSIGFDESRDFVDPKGLLAGTPEEIARRVISMIYPKRFVHDHPTLVEELVRERVQNPYDPGGIQRQISAVDSFDSFNDLPSINSPTLVIAGDEDRTINPDNSRLIASRIPGSELAIIQGVGHGLTIMDDTRKVILDFLMRHRLQQKGAI